MNTGGGGILGAGDGPDGAGATGRRVTVLAGDERMAGALADRFAAAAVEAVRARGTFRVALAGGNTPAAAYIRLTTMDLPWSAIQVFWGDERPVPPDHPDSNYRMAQDTLLSHVPIPRAHVHRMHGEAQDLEAAAAEYAVELADTFGMAADGAPPRFDLVLLGMGAEGHTASLFPDSPALGAQTWVASPFVPELGMRRLTLTPRVINRAAQVVFAVGGANKAGALMAVLHGERRPERYPAQVVAPADGTVEWLVEQALAEKAGIAAGGPS